MNKKIYFILLIFISISLNAHGSEASKSKWLQHDSSSSVRSKMPNVNVIMADKPCPTRWWSFTNMVQEYEYYNKWKNIITKELEGFPVSTIKKCTEKKYIIKNGQIMDHPVHSSNLARLGSTMLWEKDGQKFPLRIIVESNIKNKKPEGVIYNENLEKICTTYSKRSFDGIKLKLTCKFLPEPINAVVNITDKRRGKYRAFGQGAGYKIFMTNLPLKNAKEQFPEVFK
tara:strand:- start:184 stop:867 length:684 start_codon:yes stop_codon:yes gene_type:complete